MTSTGNDDRELRAEAARYALLRRLAPSMRHHLVVNLQPIGMVYEVMERRLQATEPRLADIHDSAVKINGYAKAALASSLDMVTWLSPDEGATVAVSEGVSECLGLVTTSFTFRGFTLRSQVEDAPAVVFRGAMRDVLLGALVHATDHHAPPAEITLAAREAAAGVEITIGLRPGVGEQGFATAPTYRPVSWDDVTALAAADGVALQREGNTLLRLTFPLAGAAA